MKSVRRGGGGGGEAWKLKGFSDEEAAEEATVEEDEKISSLEKSRRSSIRSKSGEDKPP